MNLKPPTADHPAQLRRRAEDRLRERGDAEAVIARRMLSAKREMERIGEYNVSLINDRLPDTVAELESLIARRFTGG